MTKYTVKTQYGTFKVTVNEDLHIDSRTRESKSMGKMITVGGKNRCVGIHAAYSSNTAHLLNISRTAGGCEMTDAKISGLKTVGMLNLAFTFLKQEMPHIVHIELEDKSDFPCTLSDGSVVGISLAKYEMMFHQQSWYERHFGAYLINPDLRKLYLKSKENFNKKPQQDDIRFHNKDLMKVLPPLLEESATWKDFFAKVYTMENRCEVIFSWYSEALQTIFDNISFDRQSWLIDVQTTPSVEYETLQVQQGGKYTRRNVYSKKSPYYKSREHMFYDDIYSMPITIKYSSSET